jgi:hypothetical protein
MKNRHGDSTYLPFHYQPSFELYYITICEGPLNYYSPKEAKCYQQQPNSELLPHFYDT